MTENTSTPGDADRSLLWAGAASVAVCLALWTAGCPGPQQDDLFFSGVAIHLSKTGELTNPLLPTWNKAMQEGKFHYQPPYYSYAMASWIWLFGVSTRSLLGFQNTWYALFFVANFLLCRRLCLGSVGALLIDMAFVVMVVGLGLRPDAMGLALLTLGLYCLTHDRPVPYLCGFLCLGAAPLVYPTLIVYCAALGITLLAANARNRSASSEPYWWPRLAALVAAFLVHTVLFTLLIQSSWSVFLENFLQHVAWRRTPLAQALPHFWDNATRGFEFVLTLPTLCAAGIAVAGVWIFAKRLPAQVKWQATGLAVAIALNAVLYSSAMWHAVFFANVILFCVACQIGSPRGRQGAILAVCLLFVSSKYLAILRETRQDFGPVVPYADVRAEVERLNPQVLAIDAYAARYLYDFDLPQNAVDWWFLKEPPAMQPERKTDKQPGVTWVVSEGLLAIWVEGMVDSPRVTFLGRSYGSLPQRRRTIMIVP